MRIERIAAADGRERQAPRNAARAGLQDAQGDERVPGQARGKALVAVNSPRETEAQSHVPHGRPASPFVAQLLANRLGLAQTRQRRRIAADEASARYGVADELDLWQVPGLLQRRSI